MGLKINFSCIIYRNNAYDKLVIAIESQLIALKFDIDGWNNGCRLTNMGDGKIIQESITDKNDIVFISNLPFALKRSMN